MKARTVAYATQASRPTAVSNGGSHQRSVRSVRAAISALPAAESVVDDTSVSPHLEGPGTALRPERAGSGGGGPCRGAGARRPPAPGPGGGGGGARTFGWKAGNRAHGQVRGLR